jgi:hypothetical protein
MTGTASLISNNGNQRDLKLGDNIQTADTIKTGAGVEAERKSRQGLPMVIPGYMATK